MCALAFHVCQHLCYILIIERLLLVFFQFFVLRFERLDFLCCLGNLYGRINPINLCDWEMKIKQQQHQQHQSLMKAHRDTRNNNISKKKIKKREKNTHQKGNKIMHQILYMNMCMCSPRMGEYGCNVKLALFVCPLFHNNSHNPICDFAFQQIVYSFSPLLYRIFPYIYSLLGRLNVISIYVFLCSMVIH